MNVWVGGMLDGWVGEYVGEEGSGWVSERASEQACEQVGG